MESSQRQPKKEFDAVIVGSGPNGLAAGITLQRAGLSVLILEAKSKTGGGLCTEELTLPGFHHDVCSAIHPLAVTSPFFRSLPLEHHGLKFLYPEIQLAHPFDDGTAIVLKNDLAETASGMGADSKNYRLLMEPLIRSWNGISDDVLSPIHFPSHPMDMAGFGLKALSSAKRLSRRFDTERVRGFWAGLATHSQLPFQYAASSAIGLVLLTVGHIRGWPLAQGGSGFIASALENYFISLGGKLEKNSPVKSLDHLPSSSAVLLDITPAQLLEIAGDRLSSHYRERLEKFRYGMGVFKIDWALSDPIPFVSSETRKATTVHLGGGFEEISASESAAWNGQHAEKPALILAQQSILDGSRAPFGKHTAWAYCHVPLHSKKDMTVAIENQVERFAPGFRDTILSTHIMNTEAMENYNPNYRGGDIGGGANNVAQLFTRPVLQCTPYQTSLKGVYLCSASTPPGGGVHGMCGYHAAKRVLAEMFRIRID